MAEETEKVQRGKKRPTDKWKKKLWYKIIAPKEFDETQIGETVSSKPELIKGRIIGVNTRDIAGASKKQFATILFKVADVRGDRAYTKTIGHEVHEGYLRRLVRRHTSKILVVQSAQTKDGMRVKVKTVAITSKKVPHLRETSISKVVRGIVDAAVKSKTSAEVVPEVVFGNLPQQISKEAKKIAFLKRVEIVKSRIIGA